ncbi:type III secretion system inner rod subunit SctI [Spartinivicinus poritis]|uniref:Type III secretion system inner rod subunit SctI n=1 Tax=Spartinivicinus poritis TaxID=2994640 RepID=A0ABT5U3Q4_9GAMM|nr:type III secretion system inner rod subunit SctI [Spartinivicinus sp. A2-2]MDE1460999.1 type III secretion system inner rod subunit SctI [Spartinivicinus sp. A2-2]
MTEAVFHSITVAIDSPLTEGGVANGDDVQQFDAMMAEGSGITDQAVEIVENVKASIEKSDQKLSSSMEVAQDDPLSMQAIMAMQVELAKKHLQEELITKIASKSTQHVDTFLKAQ